MAEFVKEFSLIRTLKSVSAGTPSVGGDLERSHSHLQSFSADVNEASPSVEIIVSTDDKEYTLTLYTDV